MKTVRNFVMAGAAGLLLATAAHAGQSTASEREQTRQLNLQSAPQSPMPGPTVASVSPAPDFAPIALNSLPNPPDKIATARVVDETGTVVGAVQKVNLDAGGKPSSVEIALLGSDRVIALDSVHLSYDQSNNVVTAAMDKSQIAQLPAAPQG